jgi:hypothetical protein
MRLYHLVLLAWLGVCLPATISTAQIRPIETDWYAPDRPHVKFQVAEDGIYRVNLSDLSSFIPPGSTGASTLRLFENGREVPIDYRGQAGPVASDDYFLFAGKRNAGRDEDWVYHYDPSLYFDGYLSLYTDTTTYFLTWGEGEGLRYSDGPSLPGVTDTVTTGRVRSYFQDSNFYNFGQSSEIGHPFYTKGEDWVTFDLVHNNLEPKLYSRKIPIRDLPITEEDSLDVVVAMFGATPGLHRVKLSLRLSIGGRLNWADMDSVSWEGYQFATIRTRIPQSRVFLTNERILQFLLTSDNSEGQAPNKVSVHHLLTTFSARLSADDGPFRFTAGRSAGSVYQFSSILDEEILVLNPVSAKRFALASDSNFVDVTETGDEFWVSAVEDFKTPAISGDATSNLANRAASYDYVIISAPGLMESAEALKTYRESAEGGGYRVLLANLQDVFDQFDFGRQTPIAMRRFIDHSRSWQTPPEFFTFWGDALYPRRTRPRFGWEVPSFGNASSDGWFAMFANANVEDFTETVSVGRVPIRTNEAGVLFVEKLASYEGAPLDSWNKRITLMAGGKNPFERSLLHGATQEWGETVSTGTFGGDVTYFLKSEETVLDPTFLDTVDATITRGTSWLAFFGHSAADTWEIITTPPDQFDNAGNLPIALSLGCFTGAFARGSGDPDDNPVYAELLVTESPNGAIAHFGGSTSSLISSAANLGSTYYNRIFTEGERILGKSVRLTKADFLRKYRVSQRTVGTAMQYNLIGDPATVMRLPAKPDFHVEARSITLLPTTPVAGIDTVLTASIEIENRGTIPSDSVDISLRHVTPAGASSEFSGKVAAFPLLTTTEFLVPIDSADLGEHRFELTIDGNGQFDEELETNNTAQRTHSVFASGIIQLFPLDLGLVTARQPELQIGAASASGSELTAAIELDTSRTFSSPLLITDRVDLTSIASWTPPSPLDNGQSYFWRVRVDDPSSNSPWSTSSFTVREDLPRPGWLQQGDQFSQNETGAFVEYRDNKWAFKQYDVKIRIRSMATPNDALPNAITVGGVQHNRWREGLTVLILDTQGTPKRGTAKSFILYDHSRVEVDPEEELAELDSLLNSVQVGEYILANTYQILPEPGAVILEGARQVFRDLGSTNIDSVDFQDMWNFIARKGEDEPILDHFVAYVPDGPVNELSIVTLGINFRSSETLSPPVGPATSWKSLSWSAEMRSEASEIDVAVLSMSGDTLATSSMGFPGGTEVVDLTQAPNAIDADEHTFVRLAAHLEDTTFLATPQLLSWYLGFESVAELTLLASGLKTEPDSMSEGVVYNAGVTVINAAGASVDTVFVYYDVTDADNNTNRVYVDTLQNVAENSTVESSVEIETLDLLGLNRLTVTVAQTDPREPIPYNNTAIGYFYVIGDSEPPLFRVTVDGIEYPSDPRDINTTDDPTLPFLETRPVFEVTLSDDNEYRPLSDSTVITILMDGNKISYNRPDVVFEPADDEDNEATLTFSPDFTGEDTTHTLKIYAQDAVGNANPSREEPYSFSFRVQTEAEVESLYPYPNPMHNFTTFMFRLRGADPSLVEDLRIRIYTLSGRVVREFDLVNDSYHLESGGLQIGWNRLQWDGTDEDGDLLANGVYLYQVFLRAEGEELMVNNESGIEKIAIVR